MKLVSQSFAVAPFSIVESHPVYCSITDGLIGSQKATIEENIQTLKEAQDALELIEAAYTDDDGCPLTDSSFNVADANGHFVVPDLHEPEPEVCDNNEEIPF